MKSKIITFFITILIISCNHSSKKNRQKRFYIIGYTNELVENTKVFLKTQENKTIILIDSTQVVNGVFKFSGQIEKPSVFGIYMDSINGEIGFFIENDSVRIAVNKKELSKSKITGSKLNDQFISYSNQSNQILSKINLLYPIFQKARAENNVKKLNEINKKMQEIKNENTQFSIKYAIDHPDSYIAAFALHSVLNENYLSKDSIQIIYNNFSKKVKKGDFAIETLIFIETESTLDTIKTNHIAR